MARKSEQSPDGGYPESWGGLVRGMEAWRRFAQLIRPGESMTAMRRVEVSDRVARVELIHRDFPGLTFELLVTRDGRMRGVNIHPYDDSPDVLEEAPEITARLLRSVPMGEMQAVGVRQLTDFAGRSRSFRSWVQILEDSPRPGRRGRSDRFYAELAADYCQALGSTTPVKDLADAVNYSESQVRNLLYEARRRGLLTKSPGGKAGGHLTPKARALLEEKGDDHGER